MAIAPGIFRQYDIRGIVDRTSRSRRRARIGQGFAALLRRAACAARSPWGGTTGPAARRFATALVDGLTAMRRGRRRHRRRAHAAALLGAAPPRRRRRASRSPARTTRRSTTASSSASASTSLHGDGIQELQLTHARPATSSRRARAAVRRRSASSIGTSTTSSTRIGPLGAAAARRRTTAATARARSSRPQLFTALGVTARTLLRERRHASRTTIPIRRSPTNLAATSSTRCGAGGADARHRVRRRRRPDRRRRRPGRRSSGATTS